MYSFNLIVGDWSHDGHNQTDSVLVRSNLPHTAVEAAFKEGMSLLGLNPKNRHATYLPFCDEYEDSKLPRSIYTILKKNQILTGEIESEYSIEYDGGVVLEKAYSGKLDMSDSESYAALWLLVAKHGEPALEYEIGEEQSDYINIGGYGLFSG